MLALADAFEKIEDSGDRVRLAFKLFDSEGVAFVNTLQGGTEALQAMFAEVDDLGIALSTATVQGVERANDAFTRLQSLFRGVRDSVVGALAPAFEMLADTIRTNVLEAVKEAGGVEQFGRNLALTIVGLFKNAAQAIQISLMQLLISLIKSSLLPSISPKLCPVICCRILSRSLQRI